MLPTCNVKFDTDSTHSYTLHMREMYGLSCEDSSIRKNYTSGII